MQSRTELMTAYNFKDRLEELEYRVKRLEQTVDDFMKKLHDDDTLQIASIDRLLND